PRGAEMRPYAEHLIGVDSRLDRRLRERGVEIEVAVEEQVAEHADRQTGGTGQDLFDECGGEHGVLRRCPFRDASEKREAPHASPKRRETATIAARWSAGSVSR